MKKFRHAMSLLLSVILIFALVSCATIKKDSGIYAGKTVILHSNDVHGELEGYAYLPTLRQYFEEMGATVITVDAGDYIQGSTYVSLSKGASAIQVMNAAGYDVVGLGNHEMDYTYDHLLSILDEAEFKVVNANVTRNGKDDFDDYAIVEVGNVKIGFLGLLTPETMTKALPSGIEGVDFGYYDDKIIEDAQRAIDQLSKEADLVICLAHIGIDEESVLTGFDSSTIFSKLTGFDFVIDAHSHSIMLEGRLHEPNFQSTGTKFERVGVILVDNATKTIEDHWLIDTADVLKDQTVLDVATAIIDEIDDAYGAPFAKTETILDGEKAIVRTKESNLGDLICDALIWAADGNVTVPAENVIALTNGGGIRATLVPGDISMADIKTVLPYGNTLTIIYVTGEELLETLEASTYAVPGAVGAFPQVAGINFTIDTTVPYDPQDEAYPGSTYLGPKTINRVTINDINGKPFDPAANYAVVTNNFVAAGGDTYYSFKRAFLAGNYLPIDIALDEIVINYIDEALGGVITEAQYGVPAGRITIK